MSSPARDARFYIWDNYWQSDRLHSFTADANPEIVAELHRHWRGIAAQLPATASVLDIACGNGAAALALMRAGRAKGSAFTIKAIEEAMIDPPQYVPSRAADLQGIDFLSRTQMESLPFENETFDAAVSQFGIEYGNINQAVAEAVRVLKPGGLMSILLLPGKDKTVQATSKSFKQVRFLLNESPLFKDALKMVQDYHESPPETREQVMRGELDQFSYKVEKTIAQFDASEIEVVSAIVSFFYEVFVDRKSKALEDQVTLIQSVRTNLAHYGARCQATLKAAVDNVRLDALKTAMAKAGIKIADTRSLFIQDHGVIAIQLTGTRSA